VGGEVGADLPQPSGLARQDELRARAVDRRGEQPLVVERVKPGERAEPLGAGRLDSRAQPVDDRLGERERDPHGLVGLALHPR
jgi:hypothetical protein